MSVQPGPRELAAGADALSVSFEATGADGVKLVLKEDIIPARADGLLFTLGPVLVLVPVILSWLVVPFGQNLLISNVGVGIFLWIALSSIQPIGLLMLNDEAVRQLQDPAGRAELEASLAELLQSTNRALDPHEQMACLVAMTEAWTVDNELITPTLKVRRNRIEDLFAANFERWVGMERDIIWHEK